MNEPASQRAWRTRSAELRERLAFLGFSEEDRLCLARLAPVLEAHAESLVAEFYRRLLAFAPTRALLGDAALRERLVRKQREYLISLATPQLDDAYAASRKRIGEVHQRAGVEPRWFLGAYALYLRLLIPRIHETYRDDTPLAERTVSALVKLLALDTQLAMDEYFRRRTHAPPAPPGALASGLTHQLGTPLNVILGHAEALEAGARNARERERLRTIRDQVARVSDVVQTLFEASEAPPSRPVRVDLRDVLEASLGRVRPELESRGIAVRAQLLHATLNGDADKLQRLFLNLYKNAADAMPRGGELCLDMAPARDGAVAVRVADSGEGIPAPILDRIFEAFFTTRANGQGLGLMVARGVVDEHGGTIEVTSQPGDGTEVRVELPCDEIESSAGA